MFCMLAFAVLCASVRAASSEEELVSGNLTLNGTVGWVSSRPGRSTSEILWSCFTVLLVCTYKCLHLNLPSQEENEAGWHRICGVPIWPERPLRRKCLRQIKWMAFIIIAPEYGVAIAFHQYESAKLEAGRVHQGQIISLSHGLFAHMGGFVAQAPNLSNPEEQGLLGLNHRNSESPGRRILTLEEYFSICKSSKSLVVTEAELLDRSKADVFTKIFAIVQSTWLVTQCISRTILGLPITELELATMAYIPCALLMYIFWWNKPFGVEQPIVVSDPSLKTYNSDSRKTLLEGGTLDDLLWESDCPEEDSFDTRSRMVFYLTGTIFSGIHLLAWNWKFPNPESALAWRVCAVVATASGPIILVSVTVIEKFDNVLEGNIVFGYMLGCMFSYVLARLGILVIILYSFSGMPVDVYKTVEWSQYFPHFS